MKLSYLLLSLAICVSGCSKSAPPPANVIRIAAADDPQTLDPIQARSLETMNILQMLYEGLMRLDSQGQPTYGIAEKVDISGDQKRYTFRLRKALWSDGSPVTAGDFEQSWKRSLDPKTPSPNAYQLYGIRGAQAAKEGKISTDEVGVKAVDPSTLVVDLEQSIPYFLQLVTTTFYYPVHLSKTGEFTFNGPFQLKEWKRHNELILAKNPTYWDAPSVRLDEVSLVVADPQTALQLFEKGELDWVGSPLSSLPTDAIISMKQKNRLFSAPAAATHWLRLNNSKAPFDQREIRRAFALAVNRKELVDHVLQGGQEPALGILPPSLALSPPFFKDNAVVDAVALLTKEENQDFAVEVTLMYRTGERERKIAQVLQQQWKRAFNIDIKLQEQEGKVFFERLKAGDYQMALGSWYADFLDPISFLEVFKEKNNGTNNTGWENPRYKELLMLSSSEVSPELRKKQLKEAEAILVDEMPIIPLYFATYLHAHQPQLQSVSFSALGYFDLKHAYLDSAAK